MSQSIRRIFRGSALVAVMALAGLAMISCYPNSPVDAEEFDVVVTFFDEGANFTSVLTFGIVDSIATIDIGTSCRS